MGGTTFTQFNEGSNLDVVYRDAHEEALRHYGNDGYNGSISTTSGTFLAQHQSVPLDEAHRIGMKMLEEYHPQIEKWGACAAIPVCADSDYKWRSKTITCSVTGRYLDAEQLFRERVQINSNELLSKVKSEVLETKTKAKRITTSGDSIIRYFITNAQGESLGSNAAQKGFATQAEAVKAAIDLAERNAFGPEEYGIVGKRIREDGSVLVRIERTTTRKVKLQAKIGQQKNFNRDVIGYVFAVFAAT